MPYGPAPVSWQRLKAQPHLSWRLHQIGKDARAAANIAVQANEVLKEAKIREQIGIPGYEALAGVMDFLQASVEEADAA